MRNKNVRLQIESELTERKAQALGHQSLLKGWQVAGTVDLQVRRTADMPVYQTEYNRKGGC